MNKIKIYDGITIDMSTSEVIDHGQVSYVDSDKVGHMIKSGTSVSSGGNWGAGGGDDGFGSGTIGDGTNAGLAAAENAQNARFTASKALEKDLAAGRINAEEFNEAVGRLQKAQNKAETDAISHQALNKADKRVKAFKAREAAERKSRATARDFIEKDLKSGKITKEQASEALAGVGGTGDASKAATTRSAALTKEATTERASRATARAGIEADIKSGKIGKTEGAQALRDVGGYREASAQAGTRADTLDKEYKTKTAENAAETKRKTQSKITSKFGSARVTGKKKKAGGKAISSEQAAAEKARNDAAQASLLVDDKKRSKFGRGKRATSIVEDKKARGESLGLISDNLNNGGAKDRKVDRRGKTIEERAASNTGANVLEGDVLDTLSGAAKGVVRGATSLIDLTGTNLTGKVDEVFGPDRNERESRASTLGSFVGGGGAGGALVKGVTKVGGAIKGGVKAGAKTGESLRKGVGDIENVSGTLSKETNLIDKAKGFADDIRQLNRPKDEFSVLTGDNTGSLLTHTVTEGAKKGFATEAGAAGGAASTEGKGTGTGGKGTGTGGKGTGTGTGGKGTGTGGKGTGGKGTGTGDKVNLNNKRNSLSDDLAVSKGYKSVTPTKLRSSAKVDGKLRSSTKVDGKLRSSKVDNKFKKNTKVDTKVITKPRSSFKPSKGTGGSSSLLKTGGRATGAAAGGEGSGYTGGGSGTGVTTKPGITTPGKATPGTAAGEGPQGRKESPTEIADKLSEQRRRAITPGGAKSRLGGTGKEAKAGDSAKLGGRNEKAKGRPFKKKDSKEYASLLNIAPKKKKELETGIGFYNINVRPGGRGGSIGL